MSEAQAERAVQAIYEDPSLRDELTDDDAQTLLKWGEEQVKRLADQGLDDEDFETVASELRRLIKRINRLAGRRATLSVEEQLALLGKIADSAQVLGYDLSGEQFERALHGHEAGDVPNTLQTLLTLVDAAQSGGEAQTGEGQ